VVLAIALVKAVHEARSGSKESRVAIFAESDLPYTLADLGAKALELSISVR